MKEEAIIICIFFGGPAWLILGLVGALIILKYENDCKVSLCALLGPVAFLLSVYGLIVTTYRRWARKII